MFVVINFFYRMCAHFSCLGEVLYLGCCVRIMRSSTSETKWVFGSADVGMSWVYR